MRVEQRVAGRAQRMTRVGLDTNVQKGIYPFRLEHTHNSAVTCITNNKVRMCALSPAPLLR